jgi:hypothetical protein
MAVAVLATCQTKRRPAPSFYPSWAKKLLLPKRKAHRRRNPTTWAEIKSPAQRVVKRFGKKADGEVEEGGAKL